MVASKNRMFRNASGKIVTVQDAVKAGLVNADDIPKNKDAAIAFRDKLREQMSDADKEKLIDAASQRVGYKLAEKNMQVSGGKKIVPDNKVIVDGREWDKFTTEVEFTGKAKKDGFTPGTFMKRANVYSEELNKSVEVGEKTEGFINGAYAIERSKPGRGFSVKITHIPSGIMIEQVDQKVARNLTGATKLAKKVVTSLNELNPNVTWNARGKNDFPDQFKDKIRQVLMSSVS